MTAWGRLQAALEHRRPVSALSVWCAAGGLSLHPLARVQWVFNDALVCSHVQRLSN